MSSKMLLPFLAAAAAAAAGSFLRRTSAAPVLARAVDTQPDALDETLLERLRRRGF